MVNRLALVKSIAGLGHLLLLLAVVDMQLFEVAVNV